MSGPLTGLKVIELAGIGPAPMAAMMLSDMGAEVIRVDRLTASGLGIPMPKKFNFLGRGRKSIAVDLKNPEGISALLELIDQADIVIEGFRPGVMERLGMGPDVCLERNPKLVYGRVTGWGQEGPLSKSAGHDLNYIALSGALHAIGRSNDEPPTPPLNLVGDFGGGTMFIVVGILAALHEVKNSGKGQVVDAGMVDGALSLMTSIYGMHAGGGQSDERASNILDSGAHFYNTYETRDGKYVSIGSIETKFYAMLLDKLGLDPDSLPPQMERESWPAMKEKFKEIFLTKTRDEWCALMENTDICFAPVLTLAEAPDYAHNKERGSFVEVEGVMHPAPAPRFSATPSSIKSGTSATGVHTDEVLADWGISAEKVAALKASGAIKA
ncbi:MAG: CoA transferase [Gammaproteobacteria bacterium]|nr:CoA transferase [Gammaproteobacteria bacterium]MBQ0839798.1 CoA transferase [Gammaproteobacteria bacterium]